MACWVVAWSRRRPDCGPGGAVVWAAGWGCCAVCSVEWEVIAMDDQVKGLLSGAGTHYQPCEPSHRTFLEFFLYLYGSPHARWTERQVETDGEREREREHPSLPVQMMAIVVAAVSPRGGSEIASRMADCAVLTCG